MFKFKLSQVLDTVHLLYKSLNQSDIIVFIGNNGTFLSAFNQKQIVETLFIPVEHQQTLEKYRHFFNKFKKFHIYFLLDHSLCEMRHELIPILQSVIKVNPVDRFITEHFSKEEIVAYNVYNVTKKVSETWDTMFVSVDYRPPFSSILNYIMENSMKFGGVYFLSLEFISIIDKVLEKTNNNDAKDCLQIFVSITECSFIKFVVKHNKNILSIKSSQYPFDRTDLYVQGIIEQEVSDCLISFKNYISSLELKVCIILLISQNLKTLMQSSKFGDHKIIFALDKDLLKPLDNSDSKFSDASISQIFAENKNFLALNYSIKSITQLNLINFIMFKPLMIVIAALVIFLTNNQFKIIQNQQNTIAIDQQYYKISAEYRNLKERYPEIKNLTNLADLYSLEALLKVPITKPFEMLENTLGFQNPDLHLDKISWELYEPDNLAKSNQKVKIDISLRVIIEKTLKKPHNTLLQYIKHLQNSFTNFNVNYVLKDNEIDIIMNQKVIPVSISITGPRE